MNEHCCNEDNVTHKSRKLKNIQSTASSSSRESPQTNAHQQLTLSPTTSSSAALKIDSHGTPAAWAHSSPGSFGCRAGRQTESGIVCSDCRADRRAPQPVGSPRHRRVEVRKCDGEKREERRERGNLPFSPQGRSAAAGPCPPHSPHSHWEEKNKRTWWKACLCSALTYFNTQPV